MKDPTQKYPFCATVRLYGGTDQIWEVMYAVATNVETSTALTIMIQKTAGLIRWTKIRAKRWLILFSVYETPDQGARLWIYDILGMTGCLVGTIVSMFWEDDFSSFELSGRELSALDVRLVNRMNCVSGSRKKVAKSPAMSKGNSATKRF